MIYFTAHTFKCVCHCRRAMFRVLGMYNFGTLANYRNFQYCPDGLICPEIAKVKIHVYSTWNI